MDYFIGGMAVAAVWLLSHLVSKADKKRRASANAEAVWRGKVEGAIDSMRRLVDARSVFRGCFDFLEDDRLRTDLSARVKVLEDIVNQKKDKG